MTQRQLDILNEVIAITAIPYMDQPIRAFHVKHFWGREVQRPKRVTDVGALAISAIDTTLRGLRDKGLLERVRPAEYRPTQRGRDAALGWRT